MDFSIPQPLQETLKSVRKFLIDEVYPLERDLLTRPFRELLPALAAKRDRVREMGLFTPQVPKEARRGRPAIHGARPAQRRARPHAARPFRVQLPGAGRRQHGDPARVRHARAKRDLAQAAGRRKDSQLLLDDRAGLSRIEPGLDGDDRRSGRRHLRDQRAQVVHFLGRRVAVRHRDGRHRSEGRSAQPAPARSSSRPIRRASRSSATSP